jgi:antitoxin (DNA-binding transcriptional repressor) of toxin-antitoxin stability system
MRTVTVRSLRHEFGKILACLERGESLRLVRRGRRIAKITPLVDSSKKNPHRPDFKNQLKERFGDFENDILPYNIVLEQRKEERW